MTATVKALFALEQPARHNAILDVAKQFIALDDPDTIFDSLQSAEDVAANRPRKINSLAELEEKQAFYQVAYKFENDINLMIESGEILVNI